jgi:transposase-like protein
MMQFDPALAVKLYDEKQHTVDKICRMMGVSKPTLYKCIEAERGNNPKP